MRINNILLSLFLRQNFENCMFFFADKYFILYVQRNLCLSIKFLCRDRVQQILV